MRGSIDSTSRMPASHWATNCMRIWEKWLRRRGLTTSGKLEESAVHQIYLLSEWRGSLKGIWMGLAREISYHKHLFNLEELNPIEQVETLPLNPLNCFPCHWFYFNASHFDKSTSGSICVNFILHSFSAAGRAKFCFCREALLSSLEFEGGKWPLTFFAILQMDIDGQNYSMSTDRWPWGLGNSLVPDQMPGRGWSCYAGPCSCAVTVERPPKSGAQVFG